MIVRMNTRVFSPSLFTENNGTAAVKQFSAVLHGRCEPDALQDINGKRRGDLSRKSNSRLEAQILPENATERVQQPLPEAMTSLVENTIMT